MVFFKIHQQKGLSITFSKRLESLVQLMSKNSISGCNSSILRHSGLWGPADETALKKYHINPALRICKNNRTKTDRNCKNYVCKSNSLRTTPNTYSYSFCTENRNTTVGNSNTCNSIASYVSVIITYIRTLLFKKSGCSHLQSKNLISYSHLQNTV